jgi:hypothetical protein
LLNKADELRAFNWVIFDVLVVLASKSASIMSRNGKRTIRGHSFLHLEFQEVLRYEFSSRHDMHDTSICTRNVCTYLQQSHFQSRSLHQNYLSSTIQLTASVI